MMPALPAYSLYPKGIGSIELLSGKGITWSEIEDLAGEDDGNERQLAHRVRETLEAMRE